MPPLIPVGPIRSAQAFDLLRTPDETTVQSVLIPRGLTVLASHHAAVFFLNLIVRLSRLLRRVAAAFSERKRRLSCSHSCRIVSG